MTNPEKQALQRPSAANEHSGDAINEARTHAWGHGQQHPRSENSSQHHPALPLVYVENHRSDTLRNTLANLAHSEIGQSLYRPLPGSHYSAREVTPKYGCISTGTNLMFKAMLEIGMVRKEQYGDFHEINVTDFVKKALDSKFIEPIAKEKAAPGDLIVGEDSSGRHMGILTHDKAGRLKVANNYGGILREDDINERFGAFAKTSYYRLTGKSPE